MTDKSRHYYASNENVSGINEQIDEYSMNFQNSSFRQSNVKEQISEMISGSQYKKYDHSISRGGQTKQPHTNIINNKSMKTYKNQETTKHAPIIQQQNHHNRQPVFLGEHVYKTIKQRFFEVNKITTDDPDVLNDFYILQRKTFNKKNMKDLEACLNKVGSMMPGMQRKVLAKLQFQKILQYYPDDVYFTLCCQEKIINENKQTQNKVQILNSQLQKHAKPKKIQMQKMIKRLYGQTIIKIKQQNQKTKRTKFGRNLSEYYQNTYRQSGDSIETLQKLHTFWQDSYERQQYGIQWEDSNAKETIRIYMHEQIQDLYQKFQKKFKYKCDKAQTLFKFYNQHPHIQGIYIPLHSFKQYVIVYNENQRQMANKQANKLSEDQKKKKIKDKKEQVKRFGRPVSTTPLTVLSKPKRHYPIDDLADKYQDKFIKTLVHQQHKKYPRYPFQYGIYDMENQIKTKQRIKPDRKHNYDQAITKALMKTFGTKSFIEQQHNDKVKQILEEQNLQKDKYWHDLGPTLQQAMIVKAYNQQWFRDCLVKYCDKQLGKDMKLQNDKFIIKQIFAVLNSQSESQRKSDLQKFQNNLNFAEKIAENNQKIKIMQNKGEKDMNKQKKACDKILQERAIQFVQHRKKKSENFALRDYLNSLYRDLLKDHKEYLKKYFYLVEGDKQCPKLLKYQFFKIVKEINQFNMSRDINAKSHSWVPPKKSPQSFNYKTFNNFAQTYTKNKNKIVAQSQLNEYKNSIWGRDKFKDRQNLMMTYSDAKQCTFQPKISKKAV